jgi:hypothetical protein
MVTGVSYVAGIAPFLPTDLTAIISAVLRASAAQYLEANKSGGF